MHNIERALPRERAQHFGCVEPCDYAAAAAYELVVTLFHHVIALDHAQHRSRSVLQRVERIARGVQA